MSTLALETASVQVLQDIEIDQDLRLEITNLGFVLDDGERLEFDKQKRNDFVELIQDAESAMFPELIVDEMMMTRVSDTFFELRNGSGSMITLSDENIYEISDKLGSVDWND